jgi:asparagine synthase (glutamine-hydrolysing)
MFAGYGFFAGEGPFEYRTQYMKLIQTNHLLSQGVNWPIRKPSNPIETLNDQMWYTFETYLQTVCNRLDKATRAWGIEAVCPFVAEDVVNMAMMLPDDMKVRNGVTKYVIKKIAEKYIDSDQIYRPKVGFSVTINDWLRSKDFNKFVSVLEEDRTLDRHVYRSVWEKDKSFGSFIYQPDEIKKLLKNWWGEWYGY